MDERTRSFLEEAAAVARQMYPSYPRCPSCGQAPACVTIWPDGPGGHFGTCADRFHLYPWNDAVRATGRFPGI